MKNEYVVVWRPKAAKGRTWSRCKNQQKGSWKSEYAMSALGVEPSCSYQYIKGFLAMDFLDAHTGWSGDILLAQSSLQC